MDIHAIPADCDRCWQEFSRGYRWLMQVIASLAILLAVAVNIYA